MVDVQRHRDDGGPVRIAAWITYGGGLVSAAVVDDDGTAVLRGLLVESLALVDDGQRPSELIVWPSEREAVEGVEYPPVTLDHDGFLATVVADEVVHGKLPARISVPGP